MQEVYESKIVILEKDYIIFIKCMRYLVKCCLNEWKIGFEKKKD